MSKYSEFGLVTTREIFRDAIARGYAVPAFNFYNMETLNAIMAAARETQSPVILAVSESAMKYMGANMLMGMIGALKLRPENGVALHLDHGHSFDACATAIKIGFSSVMIDASSMPYDENVKLSREVAEIAHANDAVTEAELGVLAGIEDENTFSDVSNYTNPDDAERFVRETGVDSLAIAIGTSHGAYKRKSETEELRFDILGEIARRMPDFPLVLHGASSIPPQFVKTINENGGNIGDARGIAPAQLRRATEMNICKINVDSDSRMAFTAGVREFMATHPANFNPRDWIGAGMKQITENCAAEIRSIMGSDGKATY